ncbi:MAG: bacterial proteasome activator family protein [Geodermatophilaceae bacterium]|nr:bacterial proteasome activator family protein [Geodermatophilaceae bacterium]
MTEPEQKPQQPQVVVIGPDGQPIGTMPASDGDAQSAMLAAGGGREGREAIRESGDGSDGSEPPGEMVNQPAKVMRIGSMIKQLLDEVRAAPLDEASRNRLRQVHERSIHELEDGLSPELREELHRLSLPFGEDSTPSDAELRIAQAQLVGWLEGLFHGIQTTLFAQQMAARMQLEDMRRRALPGGPSIGAPGQPDGQPGMPGYPGAADGTGSGQYL